jgi:hypothetical protein
MAKLPNRNLSEIEKISSGERFVETKFNRSRLANVLEKFSISA